MSYMNQYWDRETVIDACRELDAARLAEGNMRPIKFADIRNYEGLLDIPSTQTIHEYVGGINTLNEELGRITTKLALSWSTEQWGQNAQWARDVLLGQGIRSFTQDHINKLAVVGLVPNTDIIGKIWDSVPNYRRQNTLEMRPNPAKTWNKDDSIAGGKAFAAYLGHEVGFPLMPDEFDMYEAIRDGWTPNMGELEKLHGTFEDYLIDIGFINDKAIDQWTDQDWKDNYDWLKAVWEENGREITGIRELLIVAGRLHIGPNIQHVIDRWDTMINYGKHVGFENSNHRSVLSDEGIKRGVIQIFATKQTRVTMGDIDDHSDMGMNMINKRFKGLAKVNLELGAVCGVRGWSRDKLLWWSVMHFMAEHDHAPDSGDLKRCSKIHRGPSNVKIYQEFNHSMDTYRHEIERANEWLGWQLKGRTILYHGAEGGFSPTFLKLAITRNSELFHIDRDIKPQELDVFYRLQKAGVDTELLIPFMHHGISFTEPKPQLEALASALDAANMLSVFVLKRLEPYIAGLAPPTIEMSWSDFIASRRSAN